MPTAPHPAAAYQPTGHHWSVTEDGRRQINHLTGRTAAIYKRVSPTDMIRSLDMLAHDIHFFRTGSGKKSNAFIAYSMRGERRIRYHETDILTRHADGSIAIRFDGWHTMSTRERMDEGFKYLGLPLRVCANGKGKARIMLPDPSCWRTIAIVEDEYTISADDVRKIKGL